MYVFAWRSLSICNWLSACRETSRPISMSCFGENRFHPGFNFVLLSAAYAATARTTMNPKRVKSLDFLENIAEEPPSHRRSLYIKDRESELSRMQTLVELLPEIKRLGNREAVRWSNGFRT